MVACLTTESQTTLARCVGAPRDPPLALMEWAGTCSFRQPTSAKHWHASRCNSTTAFKSTSTFTASL